MILYCPVAPVVFEFVSHRCGDISIYLHNRTKKMDQLVRTPGLVGTHDSTPVDKGRKSCNVLGIIMRARTVGRSARDVTPDLIYFWERAQEWCGDNMCDEESKKVPEGVSSWM